jgi:hypothetical protein
MQIANESTGNDFGGGDFDLLRYQRGTHYFYDQPFATFTDAHAALAFVKNRTRREATRQLHRLDGHIATSAIPHSLGAAAVIDRRQNQPPTILRRIELVSCIGRPQLTACLAKRVVRTPCYHVSEEGWRCASQQIRMADGRDDICRNQTSASRPFNTQ